MRVARPPPAVMFSFPRSGVEMQFRDAPRRPFKEPIMNRILIALPLFALVGCASAPPPAKQPPTVAFISDFGVIDDAVAVCKGVMYGLEPRLRIVDITHNVTPFAVAEAARLLHQCSPHFVEGTVFLAVIDPGVGSERRPVVLRTKRGQFFVLPDNGLITAVIERDGIDGVREITNPAWLPEGGKSSTFHGRDIFSPVAARLARGDDWTTVGPVVADPVKLHLPVAKTGDKGIDGELIVLDGPYGNLASNISAGEFRALGWKLGDLLTLDIAGKAFAVPWVGTFSDVPVGHELLYIDSRGRMAVAVNQGDFSNVHKVRPPAKIHIPRKPK